MANTSFQNVEIWQRHMNGDSLASIQKETGKPESYVMAVLRMEYEAILKKSRGLMSLTDYTLDRMRSVGLISNDDYVKEKHFRLSKGTGIKPSDSFIAASDYDPYLGPGLTPSSVEERNYIHQWYAEGVRGPDARKRIQNLRQGLGWAHDIGKEGPLAPTPVTRDKITPKPPSTAQEAIDLMDAAIGFLQTSIKLAADLGVEVELETHRIEQMGVAVRLQMVAGKYSIVTQPSGQTIRSMDGRTHTVIRHGISKN